MEAGRGRRGDALEEEHVGEDFRLWSLHGGTFQRYAEP